MASPLAAILRSLEPERRTIEEMEERFARLIREYDVRAKKKNYSQRLSDVLARQLVTDLGRSFPGIEAGERRAGGRERPIRVDVRYHTPYGLGLGLSIKTLNFRDGKFGRYTKNIQRVDKELNAEAVQIHGYQPKAVLAALFLMPEDARHDGERGRSSFEHALEVFRKRVGRADETQPGNGSSPSGSGLTRPTRNARAIPSCTTSRATAAAEKFPRHAAGRTSSKRCGAPTSAASR